MKPLQILTIENPKEEKLLRTKSENLQVQEITTLEFHTFLDQLALSLIKGVADDRLIGVGLSAVQIGKLLNVFIAYDGNSGHYIEYINPQLELKGSATDIRDEVCLSIPGKIGEVERHKRVKMTWFDREGNEKQKEFTGFNARIMQHEYDHLQGVLFTDKAVTDSRTL